MVRLLARNGPVRVPIGLPVTGAGGRQCGFADGLLSRCTDSADSIYVQPRSAFFCARCSVDIVCSELGANAITTMPRGLRSSASSAEILPQERRPGDDQRA